MAMMAYIAMGREDKKYTEKARAIGSCFARIAALQPLEHISIVTASLQFRDEKPGSSEKDPEQDAQPVSDGPGGQKDRMEQKDFRRDRRPPRNVMKRTR
jgi:hypothetical protein